MLNRINKAIYNNIRTIIKININNSSYSLMIHIIIFKIINSIKIKNNYNNNYYKNFKNNYYNNHNNKILMQNNNN